MKTASLQHPDPAGMPKVQSEANVEFKHLKYAEMEVKVKWKTMVVFKECLEFCTPELRDELRKLDPNISDEALDKTMLRFMQFDSVRRSLTEIERVTNIMDPGLMSGQRVKHYRDLVNNYLEERGLSDEHGPVKEAELNSACKAYHEMDEEDQETLDKFQEILKKKQGAAKAEKEAKGNVTFSSFRRIRVEPQFISRLFKLMYIVNTLFLHLQIRQANEKKLYHNFKSNILSIQIPLPIKSAKPWLK